MSAVVKIVLCGGEKSELFRLFEENLKWEFRALAEGAAVLCGEELVLVALRRPAAIRGEALLVVDPAVASDAIGEVSGGVTALVSSGSPAQLSRLAEMRVRTVVCGMSQKDTVTFSSRGEGAAVVSLQRTVENVRGVPVEPMEFSAGSGCAGYDPALVLLYAAALLLSGQLREEREEDAPS